MNCQEATTLSHAYSDAELDLITTVELEKHLAGCPRCSKTLESVRALKATLNSSGLYVQAPDSLRRRIRAAVRPEGRKTARVDFWKWLVPGVWAPLAGLALIAVLLLPLINRSFSTGQLTQEVTAAHVRSLMLEHKTDVASSDQHTVKPWFEGKLDFAPPVTDLAAQGFPLVGGRLDYLQGRRVAALVYQRHKHFINLFVWPASNDSNTAPKKSVYQGYNLVEWNNAGMTFWAVSDLNSAELEQFEQLLK